MARCWSCTFKSSHQLRSRAGISKEMPLYGFRNSTKEMYRMHTTTQTVPWNSCKAKNKRSEESNIQNIAIRWNIWDISVHWNENDAVGLIEWAVLVFIHFVLLWQHCRHHEPSIQRPPNIFQLPQCTVSLLWIVIDWAIRVYGHDSLNNESYQNLASLEKCSEC